METEQQNTIVGCKMIEMRNGKLKAILALSMVAFCALVALYLRSVIPPVGQSKLKQMQVRMSQTGVASLLGDPETKTPLDNGGETWSYSGMSTKVFTVHFGPNNRVMTYGINDRSNQ